MTRRQARRFYLAGFVALACAVTAVLSAKDRPSFRVLSVGLAYASLALLFVSLITGP